MLTRAWSQLSGRLENPLSFRFVLQPCMAAILALKSGIDDAHRRRGFLWTLFADPAGRRALTQSSWHDVGRVFALACVIDIAYQLSMFRWVYPLQTVIIGCGLAVLPYAIARAVIARGIMWCSRR